jgi:hypothetical protein
MPPVLHELVIGTIKLDARAATVVDKAAGDVLVLSFQEKMTAEAGHNLREMLRDFFGIEVVIVDGVSGLGVIKAEDKTSETSETSETIRNQATQELGIRNELDFPEGSKEYWVALHDRMVREGRLPAVLPNFNPIEDKT